MLRNMRRMMNNFDRPVYVYVKDSAPKIDKNKNSKEN